MKKIKMIYKWIIISITLQTIILVFLNYFYLPFRGRVKATIYEHTNMVSNDWSMKIPDGAGTPCVSNDGRYAAYLYDGKLMVMDAVKKKEIAAITAEEGELTYYRWLPDRRMLIYASCSYVKKHSTVTISTYDVMTGDIRHYPDISRLPLYSKAVGIELSPITNIVYVKIKTGDERALIYKFNIMDDCELVANTELGAVIRETNYSDKLIYQKGNYMIVVKDGSNKKEYVLEFPGKMALLGIDSEDKVYAAELNQDGKAVYVYYGEADTSDVSTWSKIYLNKAVYPERIIISRGGVIYMNMPEESRVMAIDVGREYKYTGELVEITDDYIVTRKKDQLMLKLINTDIGL
ncbi:MAG TPA: hypothetical protein GXX36_07790 [Clostridiaceae bacterium]|nr:hypothetical protein [Clostridiaceae bacterium]